VNFNVEALASTTLMLFATTTPEFASSTAEVNFASRFFDNLYARMTAWLGSASNGIGDLFAQTIHVETVYAKKITTDELCVGSVCVTEGEFLQVFEGAGGQSASQSVAEPQAAAPQESAPESEEPVQPEEAPEPAPEPVSTPVPEEAPAEVVPSE
jgi:hypothetical protein